MSTSSLIIVLEDWFEINSSYFNCFPVLLKNLVNVIFITITAL